MTNSGADSLCFSITTNELLGAVSKVLSVVPAKSPKPVLSNVRFDVRDGKLEILGNDSVAGVYCSLPGADIHISGSGLLNGDRLHDILKEFPKAIVKLTFDVRGGCRLRAAKGNYKVVGDDVRDYPITPRFDDEPGFEITARDLLDMVKKTEFAAATGETRLTTNGVLFELKSGRFRLVGTDNKRVAVTERTISVSVPDFSVSVPLVFLKSLTKATAKTDLPNPVTLGVSKNKVFFKVPGATVYSSVLQGNYPPYEEALSLQLKYFIDCGVEDLFNLLKRAILVNDSLAVFVFKPGQLTIRSNSSSVGSSEVDMDIAFELPEGVDNIRVGFDPTFIKEALSAVNSTRCRFSFEGPRHAGVIRELVTTDEKEDVSDQFIYALMPSMLHE